MVARPSRPVVNSTQPSKPSRVKGPSWDLDPVASLAPFPLVLDLKGVEVEVPALTAAQWLNIFMSKSPDMNDLLDLIPDLDELLITEKIDIDDVNALTMEMITVASGRDWWITLRLLGVAAMHWDNIGYRMITKIDANQASFAAWMLVLQSTLIDTMEPDSVPMFIAQVQMPPPGVAQEEARTQHKELTAREFLAVA